MEYWLDEEDSFIVVKTTSSRGRNVLITLTAHHYDRRKYGIASADYFKLTNRRGRSLGKLIFNFNRDKMICQGCNLDEAEIQNIIRIIENL